jgi:hypothetical protein
VVLLDGHLTAIPGSRFVAGASRVTVTGLVSVPRHPEFARNEHYDLKYLFSGEARVGDRTIKFTALVDAVAGQ